MECLFCKIVKEKKVYLVGENEGAIAILDINPASDGHTLLITKKHFTNINKIEAESWQYLLPLMKDVISKLETNFQPAGFNVISNMNEIAAQSVFHLHIHIIPKYQKNQGFIWTVVNQKEKKNLEQVVEKLKQKN